MKILITGSTGFVGRQLCVRLISGGHELRRADRNRSSSENTVVIGDIGAETDWEQALADIDTVVHLAARAHVLNESTEDSLDAFRKVNTQGTLRLARQSGQTGVKRFIFISSIGVNGNQTTEPFTEQDIPAPHDLYAISKFEAEQGLQEIATQSAMEVTIIRPPLVYGPNAPGNFGSLVHWLSKGIPLPLGSIHNQRSLVALDNLVDFIITCINHPAAANQTFLVADGEDLSTTDLLRRVGQAMGKPARLIPVPMRMLKLGATMLGKQAMAQRLCGNLQVDISKARELLGWTPPVSVEEGLKKAVEITAAPTHAKPRSREQR